MFQCISTEHSSLATLIKEAVTDEYGDYSSDALSRLIRNKSHATPYKRLLLCNHTEQASGTWQRAAVFLLFNL